MVDFREYEFNMRIFGRVETDRVTVFAESRTRSFTAAALHAVDTDSVYSLMLVRDGDQTLSADRWRPSREENKLGGLPGGRMDLFRNSCRAYVVQMERFTDPGDRLQASISAPRRADAFTAAVVVCGYGDDIRVARLVAVGSDARGTEYHDLDPSRKYGGTALDLECVLPRDQAAGPARETTRDEGRAKSRRRGTVVASVPREEEEEANVEKPAPDSEGCGISIMKYDAWMRRMRRP